MKTQAPDTSVPESNARKGFALRRVCLLIGLAGAGGARAQEPAVPAVEAPVQAAAATTNRVQRASQPLPAGGLTVGGQFSDDEVSGTGDVLLPLFYSHEVGLIFLNPRVTGNDSDEEEFNLGLGWRKLVRDEKAILGANVYWDSRWTSADNHFNQLGLGLEWLTEKWDARFNYYLPESGEKLAHSFETETTSTSSRTSESTTTVVGEPEGQGNALVQNTYETTTRVKRTTLTTTRFLFQQYESALEGWDAELGFLLPLPERLGKTKIFVGYQSFENTYGADLEGWKGRLEVQALPGLFFDVEVFEEDELNGTDYFAGFRVNVPFDLARLARGENPFAGAFQPPEVEGLGKRLTEQVMRDLKVQTSVSEAREVREKRTVSSQTSSSTRTKTEVVNVDVLLDDLIVVDSTNVSGVEDGTFERPYNTFEEGETDVENGLGSVYVFGRGTDYTTGPGGLVLPDGASAYGSGTALEGFGGKSLPAGEFPTIIGPGNAPVFTLGEGSTVQGFLIRNPTAVGGPVLVDGPNRTIARGSSFTEAQYNVQQAGILSVNKTDIVIANNRFDDVSYGVLVVDTLSDALDAFVARVEGNEFEGAGASLGGVVIDTIGASGSMRVDVTGNLFDGTGGTGLLIAGANYDTVEAFLSDNAARGNTGHGFLADFDADESIFVRSADDLAEDNQGDGFALVARTNGDAAIDVAVDDFAGHRNGSDGLRIEALGEGLFQTDSVLVSLAGITARENGGNGVAVDVGGAFLGRGAFDSVLVEMNDVIARENGKDGVAVDVANNGKVGVELTGVTANDNLGNGIRLDLENLTGDVDVTILDSEASGNGANGMQIDAFALDDVTLVASNVVASGNKGYGLTADLSTLTVLAFGDETATVELTDIRANDNGDTGIDLVVTADNAINVSLSNLTARANAGDGIAVDAIGNADVNVTGRNLTATDNTGDGVYVIADAGDDLDVDLAGVTARDNGYNGVYLDLYASALLENNLLTITLDDLVANQNGINGLFVEAESDESLNLVISRAEANRNDDDGFDLRLNADNFGGGSENITASLSLVTANRNGDDGVDLVADADGSINVTVEDAGANQNDDGIVIEADSDDSDVTVRVADTEANRNEGRGVALLARADTGSGDLGKVTVEDVTANRNGAEGIYVLAEGNDVEVTLTGNTANQNGTLLAPAAGIRLDGLRATGSGNNTILVLARSNVAKNNTGFGVTVEANGDTSETLDFGTLVQNGSNSFFGNAGIDLNNELPAGSLINAIGNFFNDATPDVGDEISAGVDATNPLLVDPNP